MLYEVITLTISKGQYGGSATVKMGHDREEMWQKCGNGHELPVYGRQRDGG